MFPFPSEGLSVEWDGPPFDANQLPENAPLTLYAQEVAWGRLDSLEVWCGKQSLPFVRWSGGYSGQFGPERAVFAGTGEVRLFAADEEDFVVIGLATAEHLGSYAAILAYFAAGDFTVPPLRLIG